MSSVFAPRLLRSLLFERVLNLNVLNDNHSCEKITVLVQYFWSVKLYFRSTNKNFNNCSKTRENWGTTTSQKLVKFSNKVLCLQVFWKVKPYLRNINLNADSFEVTLTFFASVIYAIAIVCLEPWKDGRKCPRSVKHVNGQKSDPIIFPSLLLSQYIREAYEHKEKDISWSPEN